MWTLIQTFSLFMLKTHLVCCRSVNVLPSVAHCREPHVSAVMLHNSFNPKQLTPRYLDAEKC